MVAILGAGNGGLAMAWYLARRGFDANIWNRSLDRIKPLRDNMNTILVRDYTARLEKEIKVAKITEDINEAIYEKRYLVIITPGTAHKEIAEKIAPYISEQQIVVLMPGRTYGSIEFCEVIKSKRGFCPECFETQTILHTYRAQGNIVDIYATKPKVLFSAYQCKNNGQPEMLERIFPEFYYTADYFSVTLNNIGAMLHPLITILNTGRVEMGEEFKFYHEGLTPSIARYIEKMDQERKVILSKVKGDFIAVKTWLEEEYGTNKPTLYESIKAVSAYRDIMAPGSLMHRYIFDDVLTGLVPIYYTGKAFGLEMEYTKVVIEFIWLIVK